MHTLKGESESDNEDGKQGVIDVVKKFKKMRAKADREKSHKWLLPIGPQTDFQ